MKGERRGEAASPASPPAIRDGHWRAVEMLEDQAAFRATINAYEQHLGPACVYLRSVEKGFTVISLDHEGCASMIGVGGCKTGDECLAMIPPTPEHVARACAGYIEKRNTLQRRSAEERYALQLIRGALTNGLRIPGSDWHFIHQEWRFPSGEDVGKVDLLGVDLESRRLVVIELKDSERKAHLTDRHGRTAEMQAERYADLFVEHADALYPFFERLARAMAVASRGPESMRTMTLERGARPETAVWWPA